MKQLFALGLFAALLLPSCKKAQEVASGEKFYCTRIAENECDSLGEGPMIGWDWDLNGSVHYHAPCFNPNNPSQFVYIKKNYDSGLAASLETYDLSTKETKVLFEGGANIINQPQWSKKDWILFTTLNHLTYKVKANGDSLTQLTQTGSDQWPTWNPKGNRIIRKFWANQGTAYEILSDENFQTIDTLPIIWENCWLNEHGVISGHGTYIFELDINTSTKSTLLQWPYGDGEITGIGVQRESQNIVYSLHGNGILSFNPNTQDTIRIKDGCKICWYNELDCAPQKGILAEREKWTPLNAWQLKVTNEIWLMDSNGCNERRILPQE